MATTIIEPKVTSLQLTEFEAASAADNVVPFDSSLAAAIDSYLESRPDATFFHGLGWKQAVERTFGHRFRGLVALCDEKVVGVLPLYEVCSMLAGRILVSVPYATYGGIVADNATIARQLYDESVTLTNRMRARTIEFRSVEAGVCDLPVRRTHATFIRELPNSTNEIELFLPRKARAAARRAVERHKLVCEFDNALLSEMWQLYARSMRRLASPNYPLRFFEALIAAHPGRTIVQIVRHQGVAVAGLLSFLHRDRMMPYFLGLDERCDVYGLSHYLYLQSMKWAVEKGCRVYDFGRSRIDNAGPYEFKRLCGFEPTILQYQTYVAPGRAAADLSPTSAKWSAARRIWRTLPLSVTRPLGGWLARSIPG